MSSLHKSPESEVSFVQTLMHSVGESFTPDTNKLIAASDSGHQAEIGDREGEVVVAKSFKGRHRTSRAHNEFLITHNVQMEGFRTIDPVSVIDVPLHKRTLFISRYIPGLISAHTLSLGEDPLTNKGEGVGSAVGDIVRMLGGLHGRFIVHGDAQPKNFAFSEKDVFDGRRLYPLVYDFERGKDYGGVVSSDFIAGAIKDVVWQAHRMGIRRFGGEDEELAEEVARECILEVYMKTRGAELLGSFTTSRLIDRVMDGFRKGREGKVQTLRSIAA